MGKENGVWKQTDEIEAEENMNVTEETPYQIPWEDVREW